MMSKEFLKTLGILGVTMGLTASPVLAQQTQQDEYQNPSTQEPGNYPATDEAPARETSPGVDPGDPAAPGIDPASPGEDPAMPGTEADPTDSTVPGNEASPGMDAEPDTDAAPAREAGPGEDPGDPAEPGITPSTPGDDDNMPGGDDSEAGFGDGPNAMPGDDEEMDLPESGETDDPLEQTFENTETKY